VGIDTRPTSARHHFRAVIVEAGSAIETADHIGGRHSKSFGATVGGGVVGLLLSLPGPAPA
jgi:hypothetical protein